MDRATSRVSAPRTLFSVFILTVGARADSLTCLHGAANALQSLMKLRRRPREPSSCDACAIMKNVRPNSSADCFSNVVGVFGKCFSERHRVSSWNYFARTQQCHSQTQRTSRLFSTCIGFLKKKGISVILIRIKNISVGVSLHSAEFWKP